jgi:hypothetical protein
MPKGENMPRFILTGDIICAGKVSVVAETVEKAIEKAEKGDFERVMDLNKPYGFTFDGDDDHIEVEE